jgi:hypothetical protein
MKHLQKLAILFITILGFSCASNNPFYNDAAQNWQEQQLDESSEIIYSVILIGDSRRAFENEPMMKLMESHLKDAGENSTVVFLGDNVQYRGLPDSTHKNWELAQKSIEAHFDLLENFEGKIFFIPGNHDWALGGRDGLNYIKNQRKYIENRLDRKDTFLPPKGRPGPVEVPLTDDIVLIIFDSQWWFHEHEKSFDGIVDEADLFVQIEDAVSRNRDKKIIFASHHPLFSVGNHGGHFPASSALFPLAEANRALWIPLPGFLYTGYRKLLGSNQDLAHPHYKMMVEALLETFEGNPDIIYAAGHEHNLQYVEKNDIHHIVSGAAGMATYAASSKKTEYAQSQEGFAKLNFTSNGDVWLEFITTPWDATISSLETESTDDVVFRKKLFNKPIYDKLWIDEFLSEIDYSDSTILTHPHGEKYQGGKARELLMGKNYRKEWITPVEVPVFDFNKEQGGLKIVKKGGAGQTKSLRLENREGKQWVLRSVEKDPSVSIPEVVRIELATDLIHDQMSAYLPWAALSVPRLADAAEVFHANPQIVYLTKDPRLGQYQRAVWEGLYLYEERSAGNREDIASFGRSKNIIGTPDLFDELLDDHDNRVDQENFLRCRLFDSFIGDWDRHEDQWRWAGFDEGDRYIYKAVPRDRDQTFFLNEGLLPWITRRKFAVFMNQKFDYDVIDMRGLISQGKHLDRRFINEPDKQDWIDAAIKMQEALTDEVIEDAIHDMPTQIYEISGNTIISKLKSRRDKLAEYAEEHYGIISKKVDIVGSDQREQFLVERLNNNQTEVKVWALSDKGNKKDKIYDRTFNHEETQEIRLYGLKGKDEFDIEGEVDKGLKVRIIGGPGNDDIKEKSSVKGLSKRTIIYDTKVKNDIKFGSEGRNRTSNRPEKNTYTYDAFYYNKIIPLAFVGYNADDAINLGAGFLLTTYGFQKHPFASHHSLRTRYYSATRALELEYEGRFTSIIGGLDLMLDASLRDPRFTQNYFGMGNETQRTTDTKDFNRVRIGQIRINPEIGKTIDAHTFGLGLFYQHYDVESTPGRFISDIPTNELSSDIFQEHNYAGINIHYQLDTRNNKILPSRGVVWNTYANFNYSLSESAKNYNKIESDFSLFLSFSKPHRTVLAFRVGGAINTGDYKFFQASNLGGKSNLRGYRANRYLGDACLYQNSELRLKLFNFSNYLTKGEFGILGFNDIGRVWLNNETSDKWHHGYGGGIWISPFSVTAISATYEISEDESPGLISVKFSFLF